MSITVFLSPVFAEAKPGETYILTGEEKGVAEIVKNDMEQYPDLYKGETLNSYISKFKRENKIGKRKLSPGDPLRFPETFASIKAKKTSADTEDSESEDTSLSKEEIKEIIEQYAKALKERDTDAFKRLFYKSKWRGPYFSEQWESLKSLDFGKIDKNNIYVIAGGSTQGLGVAGWIQLTPAGKIKYCPFIAPHPVEVACVLLQHFAVVIDRAGPDNDKSVYILDIKKTGIPTFGLKLEMSKSEMRDAVDEIRDWLIDNGAEYDNSEPKLFLPKKQMQLIKQTLKSL